MGKISVFVYPFVLGTGAKLFPEDSPRMPLALAGSEAYDNGVVHVVYAPADEA